MTTPKAILPLLVVFIGFFSSPADAQVNLKTGYNISFLSLPETEQLITSYNELQDYTSDFKTLTWLHGIEAGLRYKADVHGIELTYQGAYQTLKATGLNGTEEYTDKMRFALHSIALGYQASDRRFGAGTDIQYQFYKVKFTPGQSTDVFRNTQNMLALKFYLMLTLPGHKGVDMALQPYYVLPFKTFDLNPLASHLQIEPSDQHDRWNRFGLTVLFYNGKK